MNLSLLEVIKYLHSSGMEVPSDFGGDKVVKKVEAKAAPAPKTGSRKKFTDPLTYGVTFKFYRFEIPPVENAAYCSHSFYVMTETHK